MQRYLLSNALVLVLIGSTWAQVPTANCSTCAQPGVSLPQAAEPNVDGSFGGWRVEGDYLMWWFTPDKLERPLVGTLRNPAAIPPVGIQQGSLSDPNTVILLGAEDLDRSFYSGVRLTVGFDGNDKNPLGGELTGFWFPGQGSTLTYGTNGATPLNTFVNLGGTEFGVAVGFDDLGPPVPGRLVLHATSQLWSAEANGSLLMFHQNGLTAYGLLGFRYAGLRDQFTLSLTNNFSGLGGFPSILERQDSFTTLNQFYGGQVGARVLYQFGCLRTVLTSKMALGSTVQELDISGYRRRTPPFLVPPPPGGFLNGPYNFGNSRQCEFSVLSETNLTMDVQLTEHLFLGVGYSLLYWNNVQRAAQAMNTVGVPAQNLGFVFPRTDRDTTFWAHGVNFTVGLNY